MSTLYYDKVTKVMKVGAKKGVTLYGPKVKSLGTRSSKYLAKRIESATTMSVADVNIINDSFGKYVADYLKEGYIVDLGAMGNIRPKFDSKAVDTLEECDADSIRRITVQFKGSAELKEAVDNISFEYRPGYTDTSIENAGSADSGNGNEDNPGDDSEPDDGGGTTPGGGDTGGGDLVG